MQMFVKTLTGETITLEVESSDTIAGSITAASHGLPKFVAMKPHLETGYAYYTTQQSEFDGRVCGGEENVFSPTTKIGVETAKTDRKYVHLRFCCSNKYWSRGSDKWIVATSDQPEEDISKESCTLFKLIMGRLAGASKPEVYLILIHVQSGRPVIGELGTGPRFYIGGDHKNLGHLNLFRFVDWDTLVIMPKHVTFKGYNGKYLRSRWIEEHEYLEFSSDDGNEDRTAYEIEMDPRGYLRIKSVYFGKYWRRSPNWIWGDSTQGQGDDELFWPVKVNDNTIALRNAGNNSFCKALTTEGKTQCLNAAASTITKEAMLKVEELVLERSLYDIEYRLNDARIYDEKASVVGDGAATNNTHEKATLSIKVSYQDTSSYCFKNSSSLKLGVETSINTKIPFITDAGIKISAEAAASFEWGQMTGRSITTEAAYEAVVPPMSTVIVKYVATEGKCNVPFTYTQRDKLSADGSFVTSTNMDGEFTGVNYYDFRFEQVLRKNIN